jgi:hypothetical protein
MHTSQGIKCLCNYINGSGLYNDMLKYWLKYSYTSTVYFSRNLYWHAVAMPTLVVPLFFYDSCIQNAMLCRKTSSHFKGTFRLCEYIWEFIWSICGHVFHRSIFFCGVLTFPNHVYLLFVLTTWLKTAYKRSVMCFSVVRVMDQKEGRRTTVRQTVRQSTEE